MHRLPTAFPTLRIGSEGSPRTVPVWSMFYQEPYSVQVIVASPCHIASTSASDG